jgi:hypothetical protein
VTRPSSSALIISDALKLNQQLDELGAAVVYRTHSLSVVHWLSRIKAGSSSGCMQLGFDIMQRLLGSPSDSPLPAITKDPASTFHLGLTDEAKPPAASCAFHAPDHTCLARAYTFCASPINGSVRSAIMQAASLHYYYVLCSRMQVKPRFRPAKKTFARTHLLKLMWYRHSFFAELHQT